MEYGNASTDGRKILFLADRNILIDDPKDKTSPRSATPGSRSRTARCRKGREMYFAIYQAIAKDKNRPGLYKQFRPTSST